MLKSKCILSEISPDDGQRISVMSRHTLNDGKTPDERILPSSFHVHRPDLGPKPDLIGRYVRGEIDFEEYKCLYLQFLKDERINAVVELVRSAVDTNMTLLCIEEESDRCHRRILVEHAIEKAKVMEIMLLTDIR